MKPIIRRAHQVLPWRQVANLEMTFLIAGEIGFVHTQELPVLHIRLNSEDRDWRTIQRISIVAPDGAGDDPLGNSFSASGVLAGPTNTRYGA